MSGGRSRSSPGSRSRRLPARRLQHPLRHRRRRPQRRRPRPPSRRRRRPRRTTRWCSSPRRWTCSRRLSARLAAAKSMSFTAVVGYEYPSKLGPAIVYTTRYDVTMQRPDKLRILMPGDGPASEFYYDGKAMMAYAPAENLAAVADAPPTIDGGAEGRLQQRGDLLPVHGPAGRRSLRGADRRRGARVLRRAVGRRRGRQDRHGRVGQQRRVPADLDRRRRQAAAAGPGDLPRGSAQLRHEMELSNWQLDGGARRRRSRRPRRRRPDAWSSPPGPGPPPGVKPIVKSQPSQPKAAAAAPKAQLRGERP